MARTAHEVHHDDELVPPGGVLRRRRDESTDGRRSAEAAREMSRFFRWTWTGCRVTELSRTRHPDRPTGSTASPNCHDRGYSEAVADRPRRSLTFLTRAYDREFDSAQRGGDARRRVRRVPDPTRRGCNGGVP